MKRLSNVSDSKIFNVVIHKRSCKQAVFIFFILKPNSVVTNTKEETAGKKNHRLYMSYCKFWIYWVGVNTKFTIWQLLPNYNMNLNIYQITCNMMIKVSKNWLLSSESREQKPKGTVQDQGEGVTICTVETVTNINRCLHEEDRGWYLFVECS